jgi:hypothetical protein
LLIILEGAQGQTILLHTYHAKAETVAPVRRNSATDEVAQEMDM